VPAAPSTAGNEPAVPAPSFLRRLRSMRVVVADGSMAPTLCPGDRLLVDPRAYRTRLPAPGEIVVFVDPERSDRWLVKRVESTDARGGTVWVRGDAEAVARDSRRFGPVSLGAVRGQAYWLYHPPGRRRPL
jgi:nickel-type superoxide dismutase maturation protease